MLIKKTVCDKCNAEIDKITNKIVLSEPTTQTDHWGRTRNSFKTIKTLHLCKSCLKEFNSFINIEGAKK